MNLEERITELESKAAFHEDALETLNNVITAQQDMINKLILRQKNLKHWIDHLSNEGAKQTDNLDDERPPHY